MRQPTPFPLHWRILIALALGTLVGLAINQFWTPATWASLGVADPAAFLKHADSPTNDPSLLAYAARFISRGTKFLGDLFMQGLRFVAVPIVLFSLIAGVASLGNPRTLGRLGGRTLALFLVTTLIACAIGLSLAATIKPGTFVSDAARETILAANAADAQKRIDAAQTTAQSLSIWDQALRVLTANPFDALARGDMLQIVVAAVLIGLGLTLIPKPKAAPVLAACEGLAAAFLELVRLLMLVAPYAVFALVTPIIANLGLSVLTALAVYAAVVLVALALQLGAVYPLLLRVTTKPTNRVGMGRLFRALSPAQLLAFSSSSSAATLPATIECCRDRMGVPDDIASFVCPLGATINMDGTAAYQCIAVLFLAQIFGVPITLPDMLTIAGLAVLVSIGSPGLPGASIVLMVVVLEAVNVPPAGIAIILALDRVLDMCRTVVNVSGDAAVATAIAAMDNRLAPDPLATRA
jgi:Na+/H+-dicarboxylate symporter